MTDFLSIDGKALINATGLNPYLALPKEEIDHFYASVVVDLAAGPDISDLKNRHHIRPVTILHYNYNWMVFKKDESLILGIQGEPMRAEKAPLFLDDEFIDITHAFLSQKIRDLRRMDFRMAGMLFDATLAPPPTPLNLIFIHRLRCKQVDILDTSLTCHQTMGTGELQEASSRFDPISRFLIGKLYGF